MKKIEMGKKYGASRIGDCGVTFPGTVRFVDGRKPHRPVVWESESGDIYSFDAYGRNESCFLIEISPYADIPIDAPGWARNGARWFSCHFAGVHLSGLPMVWDNGRTSFTTEDKNSWDEFTTTKPEVFDGA